MKKLIIFALLAALLVAPVFAFDFSQVELDWVGTIQYSNMDDYKLIAPGNVKDFFMGCDYLSELKADLACFEGTVSAGFGLQEKVDNKFYTMFDPYFEYTLGFKTELGPVRIASGIGQIFGASWVVEDGKAKMKGTSFMNAPIINKVSVDYAYNNIIFGVNLKFIMAEGFDRIKQGTSQQTVLNAATNPIVGIYCGVSY